MNYMGPNNDKYIRLMKVDLRGIPDPSFGENGTLDIRSGTGHLSETVFPSFRR